MTVLRRPDGRNVQRCSRSFFWPAGLGPTLKSHMTKATPLAAADNKAAGRIASMAVGASAKKRPLVFHANLVG